MTFSTIGRGSVANDGTGDSAYTGAGKINALIRAGNAGQLSGFRNKLINGAFAVWQRGTSFASGASQYTADRFRFRRGSDGAGATASRQTGFSGAEYCMRVQRDSGNAATTAIFLQQQLETIDTIPLQGKTIRVSADVRAGANYSQAASQLGCLVHTGTGTDESASESAGFATGNVSTYITPQTISAAAARITWPAHVVPANATELAWGFYYNPVGTAGAADFFEITNVQLEIVDADDLTKTPFEARPIGLEVSMCERFFQKSFTLATAPVQNAGANTGEVIFPATLAGAVTQRSSRVRFRRRMRGTPTITLYNPAAANAQIRDQTAAADCTASAASGITADGFNITGTGAVSAAVGNAMSVHFAATAEL